jgi:heptosyltransferase-1
MTPPAKILVIRLSSIGDILHTLPAFQSLRKTFPDAKIDWLVEKRMRFLLFAIPGIHRVHILDTTALRKAPVDPAIWQDTYHTIRALRSAHYDLSFDFQGLLKTAVLSLLSGAKVRLGFSRRLVRERPAHWLYTRTLAPPEQAQHVTALNRMLAAVGGALPDDEAVNLASTPEDEAAVRSRLESEGLADFVIINPGGGWPTKKWAPARYGRIAARIQVDLGIPVVVTTGPGEESLYEEIADHCPSPLPRHFPLPFLQLIPLIRRARLLVGGDTGPFHLACALEIPVVGIFGPTSPARNGPWSALDESLVRVLPCSFCGGRKCPTQNECMDVAEDEVFRAVVRRLQHRPDAAG